MKQFNLRAARDRCLVDVEGWLNEAKKNAYHAKFTTIYAMRMVEIWAKHWVTLDQTLSSLLEKHDELAFIGDVF